MQLLRHLGLAARFVSGYLIQLTPDVKSLDGPSGATQDFTDLHAWAEVYLPGAGWVGLDPTSGLLAGEGHIPLAATPNPAGAAPVTGAADECEVEFGHEMSVRRIYESPRVTKPYTEEQWQAIVACGHDVDRELSSGDVRLTMGGEPTFVSIDDTESAEWSLTALGPHKRGLAADLIKRLKQHFAPGGLLHFGQGKWYPGESLPRWTLGCWWRRDGQPIWKDDALIADETVDYGHGEAHARHFIMELAGVLGVDPQLAISAYEDVWHYLWRERRLPVNVDPLRSELKNKEERARLAAIFESRLGQVIGYVLPLKRIDEPDQAAQWTSGVWFFRSGHLFLTPGDSPIGYGCRSTRCRGWRRRSIPISSRPTRWHRRRPCRRRQQYLRGAAGAVRTSSRDRAPGAASARKIGGGRRADGALRRAPEWKAPRLHAAGRLGGGLSRPGRRDRGDRVDSEDAGDHRRRHAAVGQPARQHQGHAGSGSDRSQHAPGAQLGRSRRAHHGALRRGAPVAARHREVHARRAAHRHRRGQPHRHRRAHAGRQPHPAAPRPAPQSGGLLAQPPVDVVPVLGVVHRADESASTGGRGAQRFASTSWRSRLRGCPRGTPCRLGWWTGSSATC